MTTVLSDRGVFVDVIDAGPDGVRTFPPRGCSPGLQESGRGCAELPGDRVDERLERGVVDEVEDLGGVRGVVGVEVCEGG